MEVHHTQQIFVIIFVLDAPAKHLVLCPILDFFSCLQRILLSATRSETDMSHTQNAYLECRTSKRVRSPEHRQVLHVNCLDTR